ncbi:hypothetical protein M9Y10_027095 [Tritrichomonas musculus]|uniref:Calpain catalytic domain-containing protein n=1 Tax=Tritrichomonas musculus TaxID=1915356 RepID=A0ABR2H6L3_9EUKA
MKLCTKRTQTLFETLQKSGNVEMQFEKIIEDCKRKKKKYKDPEFYPQKSMNEEDIKELSVHEWRRIEDQYPNDLFENISPESVKQGKLGDCYLVIGLIYASQHKELVKSLFHPKSSLQYGVVLVYFWFLNEKVPVIVDTQVAYEDSTSTHPLFCHPRNNDDSCWFVLVEKAFAKACGGYSSITEGQTSFGIHILFDYFSTTFYPIEDIIPTMTLEEESKKNLNANETVFQILQHLKKKNAVIGTYVPEDDCENYDESIGLIKKHAYYVLDVRESENKRFIKLRNPWEIGKYNGEYSCGSKKWTEKLKNDLIYDDDDDDGSFWMLLENYFYYFKSISYSLQEERDWKEMSVYGKIDGYLDGRSPCSQSAHVGCLPQWSIKFTKKTVVRLTFVVAGPEAYHGIYICKNHGRKVDCLDEKTEIMRSNTNCFVNGIEYKVEDFNEPYTFFFTRTNAKDEPCYFRILIQSEDADFSVKKFNDNFIKEKWNCMSETVFFSTNENDYWNPFQDSRPLSTCRQWFVKFPELKDDDVEIRFRVFKDISNGPLYLLVAKTDSKLSYSYKNIEKWNFEICSNSKYEEFSVPMSNHDSNHFVFAFYRDVFDAVSRFKFQVLSKSQFEFGSFPEPDYTHNFCYMTSGKISPKEELQSLKQWCLVFRKSPTTLFIEYLNDNTSSSHCIYLDKKEKRGEKIESYKAEYEYEIRKNCHRDQVSWIIDDISKPYTLCVTRDDDKDMSEFVLNLYGTEDFDLFEIEEEGLGNQQNKVIVNDINVISENPNFDYPEVEFFEQPENFTPKKTGLTPDFDFEDTEKENSYSKYVLTSIMDHPQKKNEEDTEEIELKKSKESANEISINSGIPPSSNNSDEANKKSKTKKSRKKKEPVENENEYENEESKKKHKPKKKKHKEIVNDSNTETKNADDSFESNLIQPSDEEKHIKRVHFVTSEVYETKKLLSKSKLYLYKRRIIFSELTPITIMKVNASKNCILVLSLFSFIILKQKKNSRRIMKKCNECLIDLQSISLNEDKTIEIKFKPNKHSKKSKFIFTTKNPNKLIYSINDHIKRILDSFELRNIEFNNIVIPKSLFKCTSESILFRLNSILPMKRIEFEEELKRTISQVLFSHSNFVEFSKIKKLKKVFPAFVSCVLIDKYINQIDIYDSKYIFPLIFQSIQYFQYILHVKINDSDSEYLQQLVEVSKNINAITFHDYPAKSFNHIKILMKNCYIDSVAFESALDESSFQSFIQLDHFQNLTYFRVSNLKNLPFSSSVSYFNNLTYLSLTSCDLLVGEVLKEIELKKLRTLKELDLSENIGRGFDDSNHVSLPNQLNSLYVDKIEWDVNQLIIFMKLCCNSNLSLLSINDITMAKLIDNKNKKKKGVQNDVDEYINNCWNSFLNNLPSKMNSIVTLNWNSNRINEQFITFLLNSTFLTNVSFCGCNYSDILLIKKLLIDGTIEKVNIQNIAFDDENGYLVNFKDFLTDLSKMKSVTHIDFTHNRFDKDCFQILVHSLYNSEIQYMALDDSNLSSAKYLLKFYRKLEKNKIEPIYFSYPILDIQRLNLEQEDINELNKSLNQLTRQLFQRNRNCFEIFPEFYFLRLENSFPQFHARKRYLQETKHRYRYKTVFSSNVSTDFGLSSSSSINIKFVNEDEEEDVALDSIETQQIDLSLDIDELKKTQNDEIVIEEEEEDVYEIENSNEKTDNYSGSSYYYYSDSCVSCNEDNKDENVQFEISNPNYCHVDEKEEKSESVVIDFEINEQKYRKGKYIIFVNRNTIINKNRISNKYENNQMIYNCEEIQEIKK